MIDELICLDDIDWRSDSDRGKQGYNRNLNKDYIYLKKKRCYKFNKNEKKIKIYDKKNNDNNDNNELNKNINILTLNIVYINK